MAGKVSVYNIGKLGVNVDKAQLQMEDGELRKAQNAQRDPLGSDGGLRNRLGLVKINGVALAGSVSGAVTVPLPKVTTRKFIVGRSTTGTASPGWNTSTDAFTSGVTTGGPDGFDTSGVPRLPTNVWTSFADAPAGGRGRMLSGRPACVYKNRFYYAGNDYTVGTTAPTIRMYDGTTDYQLGTIPNNPATGGTQASAILQMLPANGRIYILTYDGGAISANTVKTSVYEFDPENLTLAQLGSRFPLSPETARVPYVMAWYIGRLWCRTATGGLGATSKTYFIRPGIDTEWTLDNTSGTLNQQGVSMQAYAGKLFIGTTADAATAAIVQTRDGSGTYATSLTATTNLASFGEHNHFAGMVVFKDNLYAAYYNKVGSGSGANNRETKIYKFDNSSWSVVHTTATNDASAVPYTHGFVHNGIMYFVSAPALDSSNNVNQILKSSDGSSFTAIGSSVLANSGTTAFGVITS